MPKAAKKESVFPHPKPRSRQQRIANGMAVLDKKLGKGWELFIDLDTFNIDDGRACVLGQVFGVVMTTGEEEAPYSPYDLGRTALFNYNGIAQDVAFEHGWVSPYDLSDKMGMDGCSVPNEMWKKAIAKRQATYTAKQKKAAAKRAKAYWATLEA